MYEKSSFPLKANSTQLYQAQIQKFFKGGVGEGVRRKILKEKCLLIHVSMHVHIKTRQTCNSFSLSLLFKKIVFYILLCVLLLYLKGGGGVATLVNPPLDPPICTCVFNLKQERKIHQVDTKYGQIKGE